MPDIFNADNHQLDKDKNDAPAADGSGPPRSGRPTGQPVASTETVKFPHRHHHDEGGGPPHPHRHVDEYSEVMRHEVASANPLAAFQPKPVAVFFSTQVEGEQVLLLLRKSLVTQVRWVVIAVLLTLVPVLVNSVGMLSFLSASFQTAAFVFWYLIVTGFIFESFLSWFFSVYIITDERIIDVDFVSLIYRNISSAKIDNIEDITAVSGGAVQALFNFGTVRIQTAGTKAEIEFELVPQPSKVTRLLNELILEEEREKLEGRVN
ncbi:MAG: hypothetical protein COU69_03405 [Candidatus Pacebacteria bacterium CG10_big_fil_rev_8_21_14_0_10_56_10]|nr:MAG: hypothetical protein COU69_03405 [Candidatus Pacebacteria bacterium CG10_big_fil_rev_8_21_14_0_10_56_10]